MPFCNAPAVCFCSFKRNSSDGRTILCTCKEECKDKITAKELHTQIDEQDKEEI